MNNLWSDIQWRPTIGDPEPIGWIITFSYLFVAACCVSVGRRQRAVAIRLNSNGDPWFWFGLAVLLLGLGFNKQLDLQMLLIQIGRHVAKQGGWYSDIKTIKPAIVFCVGVVALPVVAAWMCAVCSRGREYILSSLGVSVLLTFVILRAMSFHPRVKQLMDLPIIGTYLNPVLELGGAALIGVGTVLATRRTLQLYRSASV